MSKPLAQQNKLLGIDAKNSHINANEFVTGLFSENVHSCGLCGSRVARLYEKVAHHGISLTYFICDDCGLVFQSPRIPDNRVAEFYESEYRLLYLGQVAPRNDQLEVQRLRAAHLTDFFAIRGGYLPKYHLDIGCGSGALLRAIGSRFGCRVTGIELDKAHRSFATENGHTVYESLEEWLTHETSKADLVSLSHVLEHLTDPVGYLSDLRTNVMSYESRLLLEVPNLYFHSSLEIAHPFAFSKTTLGNVLSQAGFKVLRYKLHSVPRGRLMPLYIAAIACPCETAQQTSIRRDRYSRQRRNLGRKLLRSEGIARRVLRRLRAKMYAKVGDF